MSSVLFIPIGMYNYDQEIEKEMKRQGFDVTTFSTLPSYNMLERIYNKLTNDKYLRNKSRKKQKEFFEKSNREYDYVFVIVGNYLDQIIFETYRKTHPRSKFILYLWDDVKRLEHSSWLIKNFDVIYSFDLDDVNQYSFRFLPLFYSPYHLYENEEKKYDLCLMGSWHDERMELWNKIVDRYTLNRDKLYLFLLGSRFKHYLCWIFPKNKKFLSKEYIHLRKIDFEKTAEIMKQSKATLDVQCKGQAGLTMRTVESIGTRTKLITTNKSIVNYDFYDSQNIAIIDRDNPEVEDVFWKTEYKTISKDIMEKYSLQRWITTIFSEN